MVETSKLKVTVNEANSEMNNHPEKTLSRQLGEVALLLGGLLVLLLQILYCQLEALYKLIVPPPLKSVKNRIVLITGSGHGIGKELALLYASEGAIVVGWDINEQNNKETIKEIEQRGYGKAYSYVCDVSSRDNVIDVAEKVKKEVGDVSILINNAGIMPSHKFLEHTTDEIQNVININVMAHFWTLQAFLPAMLKRNDGHIVTLSSCAGLMGIRNLVPYCASKYAVRGLMEALYDEIRDDYPNVKTTTIYPFMVDTGLCKKPRLKWQTVMALEKPKAVAKAIMDAQRSDKYEITIPGYILSLNYFARCLPVTACLRLKDFVDCGVDSDI